MPTTLPRAEKGAKQPRIAARLAREPKQGQGDRGAGHGSRRPGEPLVTSQGCAANGPQRTAAEFALDLLVAVRERRDDSEGLATRLAELVLEELGGRLALDVLDGGPMMLARAIRLAGLVLDQHAGELVAAAADLSGGRGA